MKVCSKSFAKKALDFCDACNAFYLRNRRRQDLICRTGKRNCLARMSNEKVSKSGSIWRDLCSACRLTRCRLVKETKIVHVDHENVTTAVEDQLKTMIMATNQFVDGTRQLSLRKRFVPFSKPNEYYQAYMDSVKHQIQLMKSYATCYKGFQKLNVQDRAKVFMATRFNLITGESFIHPNDFTIACSNREIILDFIKYFEWLHEPEKLLEQAGQLWRFVQSLNFSKYETSFYLAFLFFSVFEKPDVLSTLTMDGAHCISEARDELKKSYHAYMIKEYGGSFKQREELMQLAVRLTIEESDLRVKTGKQLVQPKFESNSIGSLYYKVINSGVSE